MSEQPQTSRDGGTLLTIALLTALVIFGYAEWSRVVQLPPDPPPAPAPGIHLHVDIPLSRTPPPAKPTLGQFLGGAPDPDEAPPAAPVAGYGHIWPQAAPPRPTVSYKWNPGGMSHPVVRWQWAKPTLKEILRHPGGVCAQDGLDFAGHVSATRTWAGRPDHTCHEEDAAQ